MTQRLLGAAPDHVILDISSPKMMPLHQAATGFDHVTASDINLSFVRDLEAICSALGVKMQMEVFDAQAMPFRDCSFDRVYSISVFEHIPGEGAQQALREAAQVLKPGGRFVMTLPAYPQYLEEWVSSKVSWNRFTAHRDDGRRFYQRRYSPRALTERFSRAALEFEEVIYIAERPIEPVRVDDQGVLLHNASYVIRRFRRSAVRRVLNFLPHYRYRYESAASRRLRYLTRDGSDPQIRQVAVSMIKPA